MSATFTSPSTPTGGLQAYSIEKPVKNLYPGPSTSAESRISRLRRLLAAKRNARRGPSNAHDLSHMRKGTSQMPPMNETIEELVSTLEMAVSGIVTAAPADRDDQLKKSFGQFQEMLLSTTAQELEKLAAEEPGAEEGLYKGLGCVGRVANMLGTVANQVKRIKDGKDYDGDKDTDPATADVSDLLDHMVAVGGLALRAAVNEHVGGVDEGEDVEKGMTYVNVALLNGGEVLMKTALPEDLAQFITDPDIIDVDKVESGAALLLSAGISEQQLNKALGIDDLAKGDSPFPPKKKKTDSDGPSDTDAGPPDVKPAGATDPAAADPTAGGNVDPSQLDQGGGGAAMPGMDDQGDDPITVLGQIIAAALIQCNHVQQLIQGTMDPTVNDPTAPQNSPAAAPSAAMAKRAPVDEEALEKMVKDRLDARFEAELGSLRPMLEKMLAQPAPAKGVIGAPATAGTADDLKKSDTVFGQIPDELTEEALSKMTDDQKFMALTKLAYKNPVTVFTG